MRYAGSEAVLTPEGTARALIEAVAARRAARRTTRDVWTERLLGIGATAMLFALPAGVLGYLQ